MRVRDIGERRVMAEALELGAKIGGHPEDFGEGEVIFAFIEFALEGPVEAFEDVGEHGELLAV